MASSKDIEAGRAHIVLYVKNSQLIKGLNAVGGTLKGVGTSIMDFGKRVAAVGAGVVTALGGAVAIFAQMGSELADASARTGVAVSSLAELKFAAEQTGASFEDVEKAVKKMQQNGFNANQFDDIAEAIAGIEDPTLRTEKAMEIFGKSGTMLIPMMENIKELRQQARDLRLIPSDQAVADADKIGDIFDQLKSIGKAAIFEIGAALAPILIPALETIRGLVVGTIDWVRENKKLVQTVAMIGIGITVIGAGAIALGAAIVGVGTVVGGIATAITMSVSVLATAFTFLLSPIGLVTAAIVGLTVYWAAFSENGRASMSNIADNFMSLGGILTDTWGGVVDALMAGDLALAGRVAMAGLSLAWQQGTNGIRNIWSKLTLSIQAGWQEAHHALTKTYLDWIVGFQTAWIDVSSWFKGLWENIKNIVFDATDQLREADIEQQVKFARDNGGVKNDAEAGMLRRMLRTQQIDEAQAGGFISKEQADLARAEAMKSTEQRAAERDKATQDRIDAINRESINRKRDLETGLAEEKKRLDDENLARQNELQRSYEDTLKTREQALADAKAELATARGLAADKAPKGRDGFKSVALAGIGDGVDLAKTAFSTFSGAALIAQGAGGALGIAKEHLKVDREALENGKRVVEKLDKMKAFEFVA